MSLFNKFRNRNKNSGSTEEANTVKLYDLQFAIANLVLSIGYSVLPPDESDEDEGHGDRICIACRKILHACPLYMNLDYNEVLELLAEVERERDPDVMTMEKLNFLFSAIQSGNYQKLAAGLCIQMLLYDGEIAGEEIRCLREINEAALHLSDDVLNEMIKNFQYIAKPWNGECVI